MANLIGIDLGTTFSVVAHIEKTGRPVVVPNKDGERLTPSVVSFGTEQLYVGKEAKMTLADPHTFDAFKRDMGTSKTYSDGSKHHTPTELSTHVLERLRADAEKALGPIDGAVVTIPANFSEEARQATMAAADQAGLPVKNIINEPTAAALFYAYESGAAMAGKYAVYDLGGGTFDVTIIKMADKDVTVLATEGVSSLGGKDFDRAIMQLVTAKYKSETGGDLDPEDYGWLDAEEHKIQLSSREECVVRLRSSAGKARLTITRAEFEEAISPLIAQTEMLCENVLEQAGLSPEDLNGVFLAGGSTRTPRVLASLKNVFRMDPIGTANVDEVVALGAALYALNKATDIELDPLLKATATAIKVQDIAPKYYGVISIGHHVSREAMTLQNSILIKKGKPTPCSVTEDFFTTHDGQEEVSCTVTACQTEETDPTFVHVVWKGGLEVPGGRPAGQKIKVTFGYNENGMMNCSFRDEASGKETKVDLNVGAAVAQSEDVDKFTVE